MRGGYTTAVSMTKCKKCRMMFLEVETIRREQLSRASETQRLAWSGVQPPGNRVQLFLAEGTQVTTLWQVLPQQTIGVFVDAALPRAVRIGKVHLDAGSFRQSLMLCHFPALIVSQGQSLLCLDAIEYLAKAAQRCFGTGILHSGQHREQGGALHQRTDTIRKRALLIFTLADYVAQGIITPTQAEALMDAVKHRHNILVAGGTGTGKTTLANALLHTIGEISPKHRLVILEDTRELQCAAPNVVFLRTSEGIDMTRLLRATLRMRPDRIVVGEVRGAEALALLKAWNTGHPGGVGTVHANDAQAALIRLGQLIQEANVPPNPELIAETVNVVVSIKRTATGRKIEEIVRVIGYKDGGYVLRQETYAS